jgi:undecaprenyl-diphosphatase
MFSVFKNINRFAGKSELFDWFAIFCAKYLLYVMIAVLFLSALALHSKGIFFYSLLSGLVGAFVFNTLIYVFYKKQRPAEFKSSKVLITVPQNPSFPSRHAALAFGLSFYVFFYSYPLAIFFLICSCVIGVARVFCGVHWFSDILGGVVSGAASSVIIYYLALFMR